MPRRSLRGTGGMVFHVLNRGVRRARLFHEPADYDAFLRVLRQACERVPMRLLAFAVMPNHWHLVLWPRRDGDLTKFVSWLSLTHACRWQIPHETRGTGPVYQGRFKAIPVENDAHFLTLCRYVERNAVRAQLAIRAQDWPWSSVSDGSSEVLRLLHPWPVPKPPQWLDMVNQPETDVALRQLRQCVSHSAPFGCEDWCASIANRLRWTSGLRPQGRPPRGGDQGQQMTPGVITAP